MNSSHGLFGHEEEPASTREDAERYVLDAIEFTLEEEIEDLAENAEVVTYALSLTKAN